MSGGPFLNESLQYSREGHILSTIKNAVERSGGRWCCVSARTPARSIHPAPTMRLGKVLSPHFDPGSVQKAVTNHMVTPPFFSNPIESQHPLNLNSFSIERTDYSGITKPNQLLID